MPGLAGYVHVTDDDGVRHGFGPGDAVPDWAAARITNPKAWADGAPPAAAEQTDPDVDDPPAPVKAAAKAAPAKRAGARK